MIHSLANVSRKADISGRYWRTKTRPEGSQWVIGSHSIISCITSLKYAAFCKWSRTVKGNNRGFNTSLWDFIPSVYHTTHSLGQFCDVKLATWRYKEAVFTTGKRKSRIKTLCSHQPGRGTSDIRQQFSGDSRRNIPHSTFSNFDHEMNSWLRSAARVYQLVLLELDSFILHAETILSLMSRNVRTTQTYSSQFFSMLCSSIIVWFGHATNKCIDKLYRIVRNAEKVIGVGLLSLEETYRSRVLKRMHPTVMMRIIPVTHFSSSYRLSVAFVTIKVASAS